MKKIIVLICFFSFLGSIHAQKNPCATKQKDFQTWLTELPRPELDPKSSYLQPRALTYIPMHYHIVTEDNGQDGYPKYMMYEIHCDLNYEFERNGIDIRFYLDTFSYIKSSKFFKITKPEDDEMTAKYNTLKHCNVYLVSDPNGACGYVTDFPQMGNPASNRSSILIQSSNLNYDCSNPGNKTLPHEMGHWLNIYHTFSGWEGQTTYPPNLTQHPKTEWENKARTGTGANCATKGDGFCDTDPDYIPRRWTCPYTGAPMADPTGSTISMVLPGRNFMSYSDDACSDTFTPQQRTKMLQAMDLFDERKDLKLVPLPNQGEIPGFTYYAPKYNSNINYRVSSKNFKLTWNSSPNTTKYLVTLHKDPSSTAATYKPAFNFVPAIIQPQTPFNLYLDTLISDTFFNIPQSYFGVSANNNYYYWRVRAINRISACGDNAIPVQGFRVYNLNTTLKITQPKCNGDLNASIEVMDSSGLTVNYKLNGTTTGKLFSNLAPGNYFVEGVTPDNNTVRFEAIIINPKPITASATYPGNFSSTVTASGGTPPYTYSWSNGKTGPTQTGLAAGNYNITITDINGCKLLEYQVKINTAGGGGNASIQSDDLSNLDLYPTKVQFGDYVQIGTHDFNIDVEVLDIAGKKIQGFNLQKSQDKFQWNIDQKGFFFVKIRTKNQEKTVKIESF
jgi:hypothetical protein